MSLFEDNRFFYRDTFFIYFQQDDRPSAAQVNSIVEGLGDKFQVQRIKDTDGAFRSICIHCPQDYSAMDITYVEGEEVIEQVRDNLQEMQLMTWTGDEQKKLAAFEQCNARLDVFHFEQISEGQEDDEVLDPGGLLMVVEKLATLCRGVSLDPQSQTLL